MIFTAIGTFIAGALFAGSTLAASLIAGGLAFGAKYLVSSYLNRRKQRNYSAVQGQTQYGGDVPVATVLGLSKVKGQRVFYAKWGSGDKYNAEVFALANGWCDGLEPEIYFYGAKHDLVVRPIIGNEAAHYGVNGFGSLISIRFYDGRPGQGPDTKLVADTAGIGTTWKATSRGTGITYVVVERLFDAEKFDKGRPDFDFVLRGLREYDPRKDATVAGGSGPQRLDDMSTWTWTQNPAVHRLNYQLGLKGRISGRTLIGEGKSMGQMDLATYVAAMNVCDTVKAGKPTYACSLFVTGEDDHTEILKEFDDAMAGYGLNRRGLSGVIPGAPQMPVLEITAADLPVDRRREVQYRKSAFDLYNHLSGQFTSREKMWEPESLKPVFVNADVTADGRARQTSNDFLQVLDPDTAQYLLTIRYRQNRKGGALTLPVSSRVGLSVMEGEWVTFEGKEWLVTNWECDETFRFTLNLAETGADIYDDADIQPGPIVVPTPDPINPSLLSTVAGFNVAVGMVQGEAGYEIPILRFTWTPPADPSITAVRFEYSVLGGTEVFRDQSADPESGEYVTSASVVSGKVYLARATIVTTPDRFKTWTAWDSTEVVTGRATVAMELSSLSADLRALLTAINVDVEKAFARLEQLALAASDAAGVVSEQHAVAVRFRDATAAAMLSLDASVGVIDDKVTAQAAALLGVETSVGDLSAGGLISFQAQVPPPAGVLVQINILARVTTADAFKVSGMAIQIYDAAGTLKSRIALLADQIVFVSPSGEDMATPIVFEDGEAKLQVARIGTAIVEMLQTPSGKTRFGVFPGGAEGLEIYT